MKPYRTQKMVAAILLALCLVVSFFYHQRESSALTRFRDLIAKTRHESTKKKVAMDWDELMKSWSELAPAEKQLIIREKQNATKATSNRAIEAYYAADSKEARERILDAELVEWERKKAASEWAPKGNRRQEPPAKDAFGESHRNQNHLKAKEEFERSYLDSCSVEERIRRQAYYDALKARYRERND